MDYSLPGFPVLPQLPELAQTHVYQVGDAIQPSHPLSLFLLLLSIFPSIRVFSKESILYIRWPSIGVLASASVLPKNIQDWFPLWLTDLLSLKSKGLSRVFSNTTVQKHQFFCTQLSSQSNSHIHTWTTGKTIALTRWSFVGKAISLFFNMLSTLVIAFPQRSKCLLISWLQSPSAVILEPKKIKSVNFIFHCFPIYFPWSDGTRCCDLSFMNVEF